MPKFDYAAPAEIFGTGRNARTRQRVAYRRFHSGAEAVRFAVEDIPAPLLVGVVLEIRRGPLRSPRHPRPLRIGSLSARPPCRRGLAAAASPSAGRSRCAAWTACSQPRPIGRNRRGILGRALLPGLAPRRHLARPAARRQERLLRDDPASTRLSSRPPSAATPAPLEGARGSPAPVTAALDAAHIYLTI